MEKFQSLADYLGADDPRPEANRSPSDFDVLINVIDPTTFCQKILQTREFRQYIMNGIVMGDLPPAVVTRVMDHAWGKPVDRVEHTGKDGRPIETVTEVRRIIIRVDTQQQPDDVIQRPCITH